MLKIKHYFYLSDYPIWVSATIVGLIAVFYAKLITLAQNYYLSLFHSYSLIVTLASPFVFVLATYLVKRLAPEAKGSGIPQVLQAIETSKTAENHSEIWFHELVSVKTAFIKILSSLIGILGGASIGREGPTVQIAASGFAWIGRRLHKRIPEIDFQTYLISGAAAGIAAAFNTPLAGITFALEEISEGIFVPFRQGVMLAVIIAGITSQIFSGNYLYFGHPELSKPTFFIFPEALLIGTLGGILGGSFARLLAFPKMTRLPENWIFRAFTCGALCALIGFFTNGDTAGSGYEVTRKTLENKTLEETQVFFPIFKLCTTVFSYLSGMAGGIFSPSLTVGAGLGVSIAKLANFGNFHTCALMGMVSFFTGVVQAPLTAVIIVMEMTDEHILILPLMISAFLAHTFSKRIMPAPLYAFLAGKHSKG